jgi:hypothetical protein
MQFDGRFALAFCGTGTARPEPVYNVGMRVAHWTAVNLTAASSTGPTSRHANR